LRAAGIITGTRKGLEVQYQVSDPTVVQLIHVLFPDSNNIA
jgi:ArsR family transcriptional regulator